MITYRRINKKKSLKMKYIVTKYQNDGNPFKLYFIMISVN